MGFSKEVCSYMTDADRLKLICQSDGIASGRVTCPGNNPVLVKIRVHCSLTLRENKSPLFVDTSEHTRQHQNNYRNKYHKPR